MANKARQLREKKGSSPLRQRGDLHLTTQEANEFVEHMTNARRNEGLKTKLSSFERKSSSPEDLIARLSRVTKKEKKQLQKSSRGLRYAAAKLAAISNMTSKTFGADDNLNDVEDDLKETAQKQAWRQYEKDKSARRGIKKTSKTEAQLRQAYDDYLDEHFSKKHTTPEEGLQQERRNLKEFTEGGPSRYRESQTRRLSSKGRPSMSSSSVASTQAQSLPEGAYSSHPSAEQKLSTPKPTSSRVKSFEQFKAEYGRGAQEYRSTTAQGNSSVQAKPQASSQSNIRNINARNEQASKISQSKKTAKRDLNKAKREQRKVRSRIQQKRRARVLSTQKMHLAPANAPTFNQSFANRVSRAFASLLNIPATAPAASLAGVVIVIMLLLMGGSTTVSTFVPLITVTQGCDGTSSIVQVALAEAEEGPHVGGDKYWSAAGFSGRVEWCGCFVGYCAQKAGFVSGENMPSGYPLAITWASFYTDHPDKGTVHKNDGTYVPKPGAFGVVGNVETNYSEHVGIVEKCENNYVYTIEGNSGDAISRNIYYLGSYWNYFVEPMATSVTCLDDIDVSIESLFKHFTKQGFSKEATAAMLGVWQAESGIDPTTVEGIYDEPYQIGPRKRAASSNWSAYTTNTLFPLYAGRLSINRSAYVGRDGKYYPGLGMAQYTGPRATDLLDYAKSHNYQWYSIQANIGLFEQETATVYSYLKTSDFMQERDLGSAVSKFVLCYEMPGGIPYEWYLKRYQYAEEILRQYG